MGKYTLALTPSPAVPRSPSRCGITQESSLTRPTRNQVLLESPPTSLSSLRDSAFPNWSLCLQGCPQTHPPSAVREVSKAQSEEWRSFIQPIVGSSLSSLEGRPGPHLSTRSQCSPLPTVTRPGLCKLGGSGQNLLHLFLTPPPRTYTPFDWLP